jgi:hypothetical protein
MPRSSKSMPEPATRSLTVPVASTSDGPAAAATRAPTRTATPKSLSSRISHSPVCTPTRTCIPSGRTACTIRQPHAPLVEQDQPGEGGQLLAEPPGRGQLPHHIQVGERALRVDQVGRPVPEDLVGNMDGAAFAYRDRCLSTTPQPYPCRKRKQPQTGGHCHPALEVSCVRPSARCPPAVCLRRGVPGTPAAGVRVVHCGRDRTGLADRDCQLLVH